MTKPLRIYVFTLTSADALAWESLPRELSGRTKAAMVASLFAGGMLTALLPEPWVEGWYLAVVIVVLVAVLFGVWTLVLTLGNYRRAGRRFPQPLAVEVEDWGDSLTVREGGKVRHEAYETFVAVVPAAAHLFLPTAGDVVILPRRAAEAGELEALAYRVEAAGRDPEE